MGQPVAAEHFAVRRPPAASAGAALLTDLSRAQVAAVQAVTGPVCILAGAGSGKTRTITHRIANQVHRGVARPDQVLALTFTERAASELQLRLRQLGIGGSVRATTFHAAAYAQIRYFWPRERALPGVLDRKVPLLLPLARDAGVEATDLAGEIEWAKARLITPEQYARAAQQRDAPLPPQQMAALYARYERLKTERELLDFDDMLAVAAELLTDVEIAAEVHDRYRFFTVDEFQDVNPAQWQLLRRWLGEREELCVVGDDDQTIYSFSGATSDYLRNFTDHFPHATVVALHDNYRSTAPVLELANCLLRAGRHDAKELRPQHAGGPQPRIVACDNDEVERRKVLDWIRGLIDDGVPVDQIAVCVRINSQTPAWEEVFGKAGVPARVHGDRTFFERPEIRQALRALRGAAGAPSPPRDATPPPGDARAAGLTRPDRIVERVLRERLSWHPKREPHGHAAKERWRNVSTLYELVVRITEDGSVADLAGVLHELGRRARTAGPRAATPAVTLLTLHKAKGSEFDAVCLVGLEEGLMPITYATTAEELAEERRLLYVGMTRARRYLWLSWAQQRPGWSGKPTRRRRSRFLDDLQPPPPPDERLAGELRAWRLQRARSDEVPPYVVFSDRTLRELASAKPASASELLAIHGFGSTKVQRYGSELLALLGRNGAGSPSRDSSSDSGRRSSRDSSSDSGRRSS